MWYRLFRVWYKNGHVQRNHIITSTQHYWFNEIKCSLVLIVRDWMANAKRSSKSRHLLQIFNLFIRVFVNILKSSVEHWNWRIWWRFGFILVLLQQDWDIFIAQGWRESFRFHWVGKYHYKWHYMVCKFLLKFNAKIIWTVLQWFDKV